VTFNETQRALLEKSCARERSDEAIHLTADHFASLAMTNRRYTVLRCGTLSAISAPVRPMARRGGA
jgi:hypothetical protein